MKPLRQVGGIPKLTETTIKGILDVQARHIASI